jgi:hypothetical protein
MLVLFPTAATLGDPHGLLSGETAAFEKQRTNLAQPAGGDQLGLDVPDRLLALEPQNAEGHYWKAVSLGAAKDFDQAIREAKEAMKLEPGRVRNLVLLSAGPIRIRMALDRLCRAYFDAFGADSSLAGVSPAEVHNRDPREVPLVTGGATPFGDGVLAKADGANVVFCQLAPWRFDYSGEKMNIKRTFRKVASGTTRLLANMGAAGRTPLLERFGSLAGVASASLEELAAVAGVSRDLAERIAAHLHHKA